MDMSSADPRLHDGTYHRYYGMHRAALRKSRLSLRHGISGRRHAPETRGGHLSPQAITHRTTLYPTGMRV